MVGISLRELRLIENAPYKKVYEVSKQLAKNLLAELMESEPKDIVVEDEEIGVIVKRIYQDGGECLG